MNNTDIESDADLPVNEPNGIYIRFLLRKIQGKAYKTAFNTHQTNQMIVHRIFNNSSKAYVIS